MKALLPVLALLCACRGEPTDTSGRDSEAPFVETLDPDDQHVLLSALPPEDVEGHSLWELGMDFTERWSHDVVNGGAMGAWRADAGHTVYGRSGFPPHYNSSVDLIDSSGNLLWSHDDMFLMGLGFTHGVVITPEGDFIALDTSAGRIVAFDDTGSALWVLTSDAGSPNGIHLAARDDGRVLLAVTNIARVEGERADKLTLFQLTSRTEVPTEIWSFPMESDGDGTWPHGPHFQPDGTILGCLSAAGQIVGLDEAGQELWRIPAIDGPARLTFPRDAVFLPDGTLLVVDGEEELLRVFDPFGAFQVVAAVHIPGIFNARLLDCASGACLGL